MQTEIKCVGIKRFALLLVDDIFTSMKLNNQKVREMVLEPETFMGLFELMQEMKNPDPEWRGPVQVDPQFCQYGREDMLLNFTKQK